jgi:hypothetical protein
VLKGVPGRSPETGVTENTKRADASDNNTGSQLHYICLFPYIISWMPGKMLPSLIYI